MEASAAIPLELAQAWQHTPGLLDMRGCVVHLPPQPQSIASTGKASPKGMLGIERAQSSSPTQNRAALTAPLPLRREGTIGNAEGGTADL